MDLCDKLRWKGCRDHRKNPEEVKGVFARNEVPYTCAKTYQPWGEDGSLVAPERCRKSRSCFYPYHRKTKT